MMGKLKSYINSIDRDEAAGLVAKLIEAGFDRDEVREVLPELLDEAVNFNALGATGPVGAAVGAGLEQFDEHIFRLVVDALFPLIWKRAERKGAQRVRATVKVV